MIIKNVALINEGYVHCSSNFYSCNDILNGSSFCFTNGINKMVGEIDSGIWAASYLLSMYKYKPEDFVLFQPPMVLVNGKAISLDEANNFTCYMDKAYPLFSGNLSVRELVTKGLERSKVEYTENDIKKMFDLSEQRFERPLNTAGNEIFRAMSAVAVANDKQILCFPWLSKMRFDSYRNNLSDLLHVLEKTEKVVIVPIGN